MIALGERIHNPNIFVIMRRNKSLDPWQVGKGFLSQIWGGPHSLFLVEI